jgi:diacylglycerol kinase (ATP)
MQRYKVQGVGRMLQACGASVRGIAGAFREEEAFRQELLFACVALPLALWLGRSGVERALLAGPVLLVLIVELVNSAIEATVDRISLERHALAGLAKDIGSAAVLLSFVLLGLVWALVLMGH